MLSSSARAEPPDAGNSLPDAGDGLTEVVVSVAHFVKDNLDECMDASLRTSKPDVATKLLRESLHKDKDKSTTLLPTTCADAFKDRLVLATCTAETSKRRDHADAGPADGGVEAASLSLVSRYYRFETVVESDLFMKQCFEMQGRWNALRRDSEEFQRAQRDYHARKLERLVK